MVGNVNEIKISLDCPDLRGLIRPGDNVMFKSVGEARNAVELCRSSSATVVTTGEVLFVYPTYVVLKLPHGVRECAHPGTIVSVFPMERR